MRGAELFASCLARHRVRHAFEVVGGTIAPLLDALHRDGRVEIVSMRHEQAAGFAADAVGRLTGRPGLALATSGPGATNLLTALGSAYFDSSPALFVAGQVNRRELKGDRPIRQLGFQETDAVAVATSLAKAAWRVRDAADLAELLERSFALATTGRPGPVLLDVPMDIQSADVAGDAPRPAPTVRAQPRPEGVHAALGALARARRPMILAGGGIRAADARAELRRLAEVTGVPVAHSLLAVDALPGGHPLRVGMIGTYGNRWANAALVRADCLLVVGSRLDIRQTGSDVEAFASRTIHQVDCDRGEIGARVPVTAAHVADARAFLTAASEDARPLELAGWRDEIARLRARWPDTAEQRGIAGIDPNALMHSLAGASRAAGVIVTDVGQHQMWAAQSLAPSGGQRFITSGGMGAMGSGLPMAIGAAMSRGEPVLLVAGDGGFQLNLQELQTVAHHGLPIKMVVLDNGSHGMVRQFQDAYFDGRAQSSVWGYSAPDFARIAAAFDIPSESVARADDVETGLSDLWRDPSRPMLLHVAIDARANAYPKVAFGRPLDEMEPHASPVALGGE